MGQKTPKIAQSGMTLVQVMIAMGLAAILMLALSQLSVLSMKSARNVTLTTDWNNLVSLSHLVLNNNKACKTAFQSKVYNPSAALPISQLILGGTPVAEVGKPQTGLRVDSMIVTDSGTSPQYIVVGTETWRKYIAQLEIKATKVGESMGNKLHRQMMRLSIVTNADGVIQECYGEFSSAQACADLGGHYNEDQLPKCQLKNIKIDGTITTDNLKAAESVEVKDKKVLANCAPVNSDRCTEGVLVGGGAGCKTGDRLTYSRPSADGTHWEAFCNNGAVGSDDYPPGISRYNVICCKP